LKTIIFELLQRQVKVCALLPSSLKSETLKNSKDPQKLHLYPMVKQVFISI